MPRRPWLAALAVIAIGISGCGDDEGESTPATTTTSGATGATGPDAAAADADAKSSARAAQVALETYATDHDGSYEGADPNTLSEIEPVGSDIGVRASADTYEVTASSESGNTFTIERASDGSVTRSCTEPGAGGCPAGGEW